MENTKPLLALVISTLAATLPTQVAADGMLRDDTPFALRDEVSPTGARVCVIDALLLRVDEVDGLPLVELSDLAWDARNRRLYLISDDGYLFVARLELDGGRLRAVEYLHGYPLRDAEGRPLRGDAADAEGLAIAGWNRRGEAELLVSFERRPRIVRYGVDGRPIENLRLPRALRRKKAYRGKNHMLEALAMDPRFGVLTAAERPLRRDSKRIQRIFALDGREWWFPAWRRRKAAITAMEAMPDGDLLLLERAWSGIPAPIHIGLRRVRLTDAPEGGEVTAEPLAAWRSTDGWRLDNFEGLTRLDARHYLLVSDNNEALLQNSVLVLIEVNPE